MESVAGKEFYARYDDPGAGGTICPGYNAVCGITTAAAEARALADPVLVGQRLMLVFDSDGGNCTITAAHALNQTGDTIISFYDEGEFIELVGVPVGVAGDMRWRAMSPMPAAELTALS
jgi:hypothetical protein